MRDLKGFRYIARLLADPGREFHVLDLVAVEAGSVPAIGAVTRDDALSAGRGDAGLPVLDDQAREAYRRRLADVDDDIEDALRMNDIGRAELAAWDRDYLISELSSATGLGFRSRMVGATSERARTSVTRLGSVLPETPRRAPSGTRGAFEPECAHGDVLRVHRRSNGTDHLGAVTRAPTDRSRKPDFEAIRSVG